MASTYIKETARASGANSMSDQLDMSSMKDILHDIDDIDTAADYERARSKHDPTSGDDHDDHDGYNDDSDDYDDEPGHEPASFGIEGESHTKYHTSKFTVAIAASKCFFGGPRYQVWYVIFPVYTG